jgi:hypothetical protein
MLLLLTLSFLAGCSSRQPRPATQDPGSLRFSAADFVDGEWTFVVESRGTGGALWGLLWDPDAPVAYIPVPDGPIYTVVLSGLGARVSIAGANDDSIFGSRSSATADRVVFDLSVFAGGRLVVRSGKPSLQGDLTIFGSGVPVISSERGRLTPKP